MDRVLIAYDDESYDQELYYIGPTIADYDQFTSSTTPPHPARAWAPRLQGAHGQ